MANFNFCESGSLRLFLHVVILPFEYEIHPFSSVLMLLFSCPADFASSALLLLTLSCRPSMEVPVPGVTLSAETCAQCSLLFKDLLLNITENINVSTTEQLRMRKEQKHFPSPALFDVLFIFPVTEQRMLWHPR